MEDSIMAGRQRGNGSDSITKITDSKGRTKYRVWVTVSAYFDEDTLANNFLYRFMS